MLLEFEKKVADFLTTIKFPLSDAKVLIAVSGGADSIALLYSLLALKNHKILSPELHCVHINHQLRAELADKDEEFVIALAQELKIPITTRRINVSKYAHDSKLSIETAARQLRIENLINIAQVNNCEWIATGHQQNDNAETVIHRLLRGTGFRGLAGIWPVRKFDENICFIRPLLCATRNEIIQYLQQRSLTWCEDHTNTDCKYTRNHIRHKLLPKLQKDSTGTLVEQLSDLSTKAGRFYNQICTLVDTLRPQILCQDDDKIFLNLKIFQPQSTPVKIELIRRALADIGCGERDLTSYHYKAILKLSKLNSLGKIIQLPGGFIVWRQHENLTFADCSVRLAPPISYLPCKTQSKIVKISGHTTFDKFLIHASVFEMDEDKFKNFKTTKTAFIEWFDLDKVQPPLTVRFRQTGDKFTPLGIGHQKKVGKFLTSARIPHKIRNKALVISDSRKVIWLCPVRISELAKITDTTKSILQLHIPQKE